MSRACAAMPNGKKHKGLLVLLIKKESVNDQHIREKKPLISWAETEPITDTLFDHLLTKPQ